MAKAHDEDKPKAARKSGGTHRERDPGRKTHDEDEGQPTDPVRSRPDPDGARMADEQGVDTPIHGSPRKADANGPVPRVVQPSERSPGGESKVKRYKVRAEHWNGAFQPTKYILARDEDEAREHYLKTTGLQASHERLLKSVGPEREKDVAAPQVFVKELPD